MDKTFLSKHPKVSAGAHQCPTKMHDHQPRHLHINYVAHTYTYIWVKYNNSLTWYLGHLGMNSLTNHYSRWGRSEVVVIYPDNPRYMYLSI